MKVGSPATTPPPPCQRRTMHWGRLVTALLWLAPKERRSDQQNVSKSFDIRHKKDHNCLFIFAHSKAGPKLACWYLLRCHVSSTICQMKVTSQPLSQIFIWAVLSTILLANIPDLGFNSHCPPPDTKSGMREQGRVWQGVKLYLCQSIVLSLFRPFCQWVPSQTLNSVPWPLVY